MTHFIRAPLVNVNDDEMTLVEWTKPAGTLVRKGEVVAVIETTKSTADLEADAGGYLAPLVEAGMEITVGQVLAAVTEKPDMPFEVPSDEPEDANEEEQPGKQRRWTKKAEILALRHGLEISDLGLKPSSGEVIGEEDLRAYLVSGTPAADTEPEVQDLVDDRYSQNRQERVVVIGAGGAGVQILDVLTRLPGQRAVGVLDDAPDLQGKFVMGVPVLGRIDDAAALFAQNRFDAVIISIGTQVDLRAAIFERLHGEGVPFTNVIDPRAAVLSNVRMGVGNAVMPFVQIAAASRMGDNNFLSAFVDLEHHNVLGSHCTFGPGVMTSGKVEIGSRVKFGAGVFIEPQLKVGSKTLVASGVVLTRSIPPNSIVKTKENFVVRERSR